MKVKVVANRPALILWVFYLMASLVKRLPSTVSDGRIIGELGRILEEAEKPNGF
jgi:hypothetical protein